MYVLSLQSCVSTAVKDVVRVLINQQLEDQKLKITEPKPDKQLQGGQQVTCRWEASGDIPEVKLYLEGNHNRMKLLFNNAPSEDGERTFKMPDGLPQGNYILSLHSCLSAAVKDAIKVGVNIGQQQQSLTLKEPAVNAQLTSGEEVVVKWDHTGSYLSPHTPSNYLHISNLGL